MAPLYYRGASAAIVVYDTTSKDTFAKAKHWIQELHKNASGSLGTPSQFEYLSKISQSYVEHCIQIVAITGCSEKRRLPISVVLDSSDVLLTWLVLQ